MADKETTVVAIEIGDIYDLLLEQVLPEQSKTNAHLANLNGTVEALQGVVDAHSGVLNDHCTSLSKLFTRVSVTEALAGERKEQQKDDMLQIKETQKESGKRVREVARQVWEVTFKLAEIGAVTGLVLKLFDVW